MTPFRVHWRDEWTGLSGEIPQGVRSRAEIGVLIDRLNWYSIGIIYRMIDQPYRSRWWVVTPGPEYYDYRMALSRMCEQIHEEQQAIRGYSGYQSDIMYEAIVRLYVQGIYEAGALWSHERQ